MAAVADEDTIDIGELFYYLPVSVVNSIQDLLKNQFDLEYENIIDDLQNCKTEDMPDSEIIQELYKVYADKSLGECYPCKSNKQDDDHNNDDQSSKIIEGTLYQDFTQFLTAACVGIYALEPGKIIPVRWKKIFANIIVHCHGNRGYISPKYIHGFFQYLKKYYPRHIMKDDHCILWLQQRERIMETDTHLLHTAGSNPGYMNGIRIKIRELLHTIIYEHTSEEQKEKAKDDQKELYDDFEHALDYCLCYHRIRLHATCTPRFTYNEVNGDETDEDNMGLFYYVFESNLNHIPGSKMKDDEHIKMLLCTIGHKIEISASILARKRLKYYANKDNQNKKAHILERKQDQKMQKLLHKIYKENIIKFREEYNGKIVEDQFLMVHYVFGSRLLPVIPLLTMIKEAKDQHECKDSGGDISDDSDSGYGINDSNHYFAKPNIDIKVLQCIIFYLLHEFLNDIMGILQGMKRNLKEMPFMLEIEFIFNGDKDLWGDNIYKLVNDNFRKYKSKAHKVIKKDQEKKPEIKQDNDNDEKVDKEESDIKEMIFGIKELFNLNKKKLQKALENDEKVDKEESNDEKVERDILRLKIYFRTKEIKDIICNIEFLSIMDDEKPPNAMILDENHPVDMYWPRRSKHRLINETASKLINILEHSSRPKFERDKIEASHHMGLSITLFGTEHYNMDEEIGNNQMITPIVNDKDDIITKFDRSVMYLFYGGGMVRFFEDDIMEILPYLFEKDIANSALQDEEWSIVKTYVQRKHRNEYLLDHQFNDFKIVFDAMR